MESPINFLTLHRDPIRHQYFPNNQSREPFFDPIANAWIITDPSHCKELIASSNLRPGTSACAEDYRILGERLGVDFSILIFVFGHIPLCLHAEPHAHSRRRMSEFLATRKAELNARIPALVATHFDVMRREGRVEIMKDAIIPLGLDIMSIIVDLDISTADCKSVSIAFDKLISMTKRRRAAADMATLRELIARHLGPEVSEDDVGLRLALLVLGRDPLIGTLGESLYRLLAANSGRRLLDISYPDLPTETGVPIAERLVVTPFKFAGRDFVVGDRFRIYLQSLAYVDEPRVRTGFFGGGAHTCLGRPIFTEIWKATTALLSEIPLRATVLSYAARDSDYVFTCPEHLKVELLQ